MPATTASTTHTFTVPALPPSAHALRGLPWSELAARHREFARLVRSHGRTVPPASGRRKVRVWFHVAGGWVLMRHPEKPARAVIAALCSANLLLGETGRWCHLLPVRVERGDSPATWVELQDAEDLAGDE